MTAILMLYKSQAPLLPGHVEHIAGFTAFRSALESLFGPLTTLALGIADPGAVHRPGLLHASTGWLGRRPLDRPSARAGARRDDDERRPSGDGIRCLVPAGPAADRRQPAEGQPLDPGRRALRRNARRGAYPRVRDLLDRHQRGRDGRTAVVRSAGPTARLACGFRYRRRADADRPADLYRRLPIPAKGPTSRNPDADEGNAGSSPVAHRPGIGRGVRDHDLPAHRLLSEHQPGTALDRPQRRPEPARIPCAGGLVQLDRSAGQHPGRAVAVHAVAAPGRARQRTG
jgi:hypothetical protein